MEEYDSDFGLLFCNNLLSTGVVPTDTTNVGHFDSAFSVGRHFLRASSRVSIDNPPLREHAETLAHDGGRCSVVNNAYIQLCSG